MILIGITAFELPHDKTNKMACVPSEDSDQIHPVWSESSLSAWRKLTSFIASNWVHSKDSDPTGQMPRLIWVFAGAHAVLLILSWGGSILESWYQVLNKYLRNNGIEMNTVYV